MIFKVFSNLNDSMIALVLLIESILLCYTVLLGMRERGKKRRLVCMCRTTPMAVSTLLPNLLELGL